MNLKELVDVEHLDKVEEVLQNYLFEILGHLSPETIWSQYNDLDKYKKEVQKEKYPWAGYTFDFDMNDPYEIMYQRVVCFFDNYLLKGPKEV